MEIVHIEIYTYYFLKGALNIEIGDKISDFIFIDKLKEKIIGQNSLINTLKVYKDDRYEWYIELPHLSECDTYIELLLDVL